MVFILVFTDGNQDEDIRKSAVTKIKSNPDWQMELIRILSTDWAPEAFHFLASNEVNERQLFLEPVRGGVLIQAKLIRESIRQSSHTSHFYPDLFSWEVERVLRTVDRFDGMGADYLPAVKELRAALDEPSEYKTIELNCMATLDKWIKSHHGK
jgi:hypothetical protein